MSRHVYYSFSFAGAIRHNFPGVGDVALSAGLSVFVPTVRADISGSVKLDGEAPEAAEIDMSAVKECADQHADPVYDQTVVADDKGNLANVIVYVKTDDPSSLGGEVPKDPAVLDQKGCMYEPHVLTMTVGQDLIVKNDDPYLHNIHTLATINPVFNIGQPQDKSGRKTEPMKATETFRVKCDVHPWMSAYIGVFEHPFHAVSGEDGKFDIKGKLPDGDYTLTAWHEKYGEQDQQVTIKDGKPASDIVFTFKPESAMANPPAVGEVTVATITTAKGSEGDHCASGKSCCEMKTTGSAKATAAADASK
jgi:hypothetical protein